MSPPARPGLFGVKLPVRGVAYDVPGLGSVSLALRERPGIDAAELPGTGRAAE